MKPTPPNPNILTWRIEALLSVVLVTLVGRQLQPTPGRDLALLIAFGAGALFLIQRKIFDARVTFALCGVGLALVFHTFGPELVPHKCSPELEQTRKWYLAIMAIVAAYGFAALMVSEGFIKEFASILAEFGVGNRSSPFALFLTTSFIAFVVNAIVMSAGSSCAVVAPIFVPLLIRLRFPAPVAAAAVVIGAWGGFLNPADVGGSAIADAFCTSNKWAMYNIPARHIGPAILALVAANITFAAMNRKKNLDGQSTESLVNSGEVLPKRTGHVRGIIAILPLLLLIPLELLARSLDWNLKVEDRLLICLVGASIAASMVVLRESGQGAKKVLQLTKVFFGGMWKGFAEVVLLIMAAKLFISPFRNFIQHYGGNMLALVSVPAAFVASALTGSGDAVASSLIPTVVDSISDRVPVPPVAVPSMFASMLWLATEMGRNVSPISVATITCANAAKSQEIDGAAKAAGPQEIDGATVARHVLCPLLVAFVVGCLALYVVFKVFN
jgi:C4-dicarboxylate transporter